MYVDVVVRQMSERNKSERPELVFEKMDLLQMTYSDAAFDLVLDKGTCDALCTDASPETRERMKKMFAEVARLVCCSSCQVPLSVYVYVCVFVCTNCAFETVCSLRCIFQSSMKQVCRQVEHFLYRLICDDELTLRLDAPCSLARAVR